MQLTCAVTLCACRAAWPLSFFIAFSFISLPNFDAYSEITCAATLCSSSSLAPLFSSSYLEHFVSYYQYTSSKKKRNYKA
jgi:hypothetical protein